MKALRKSSTWLIVISALLSPAYSEESASRKKSWTLYHRALPAGAPTDDGAWSERGTIELVVDDAAAEPTITIQNHENAIPEAMAELSISDNAYYQVKLGEEDAMILTTVPSCHLRRSNYRDEIVLQLNSRAEPLSVAYMPQVSRLAPAVCAEYEGARPDNPQFQTTISFQTAVAGMVVGKPPKVDSNSKSSGGIKPPPGFKWMGGGPPKRQRSKGGGPAGPEEAEEDTMPKGPFAFLQKYWYVLVPMLIMNLVSQQQEEPAAAAAGEGGAQAAGATAGGAAVAATGAGTQRRGKKGKN